jgi:hypothetical protein
LLTAASYLALAGIFLLALYRVVAVRGDLGQVTHMWGVVTFVCVVFVYAAPWPWHMVSLLTIPLVSPPSRTRNVLFVAAAMIGYLRMLMIYAIPVIL